MAKKANIALVVPALARGGGVPQVAHFLYETAARSERFDAHLISLATSAKDESSVRLTAPATWFSGIRQDQGIWRGLPFTHVGAYAAEFEFQRYRARKALTDLLDGCDLVQVVCGSAAWANAVAGSGKPVAVQVATRALVERRHRTLSPARLTSLWRFCMSKITDRLDTRALRHADAIQVENPLMLRFAKEVNEGRDVDIRLVPPGVDCTEFRPAETRHVDRNQTILSVGRLGAARKNIGLLLDAFAHLSAPIRNRTTIKLAGLSAPPEAFWRRANELGIADRIIFIDNPPREELVRLYQEASVFALPSDEEGLGIVVLESMACGVPVVSTRSGGPESVIADGQDGYLVPRDDATTMGARIEALLSDASLNLAMGARAREKIERQYDERHSGAIFVDIWTELLRKRRK